MKCVSMIKQPCQPKHIIVDTKSTKHPYYLFTVSVNKCDGNCNTTNDPYAGKCVPIKPKMWM